MPESWLPNRRVLVLFGRSSMSWKSEVVRRHRRALQEFVKPPVGERFWLRFPFGDFYRSMRRGTRAQVNFPQGNNSGEV
jgi:hypothetical protein